VRKNHSSCLGLLLAVLLASGSIACSHTSTVRLQADTVTVGPNLRPIAGVQANAISFYILFVPIPGVNLDKVVNQMLIVAAKTIGADKIANLRFDIDPDGGVWALRKLFFYRSAQASGIAVQVTAPEADPSAHQGPEPMGAQPTAAPIQPLPGGSPGATN
jgi:hypothetical protein